MSITVTEKFGRQLGSRNGERFYVVRGTGDDTAAHTAVEAQAPLSHNGLVRDDIDVEELGDQLWLASVRYQRADDPLEEEGDSSFSFDTTGGTQRVTQSLQTVSTYAPTGETPVDHQGAIGVGSDGRVEGVDVVVPVYAFSETHVLPAATVTNAYKGNLFSLTGRMNSGAFRGLDAGECLFAGANGRRQGTATDDPWELTFYFRASPNRTNLTVGPITGISKLGWDYLWVMYEPVEDTTAKAIATRPRAAYVERVYEVGDFNLLGIGT